MTCGRSTCSPVLAEGCLQTSFLDTPPSAPSSGTPTAAPCSESAPPMDGSPACTCTRETSGCSIHPRGRDEWIAYMRASLAKISAWPAKAPAWPVSAADCGARYGVPLASFDPLTSCLRTAQQSLAEDSTSCSRTLPRLGTMLGGWCWELTTSAPLTVASAGGAVHGVPTPTVCGNYNRKGASATSGDGLATWVANWPTPMARDHRTGDRPESLRRARGAQVGLNDAAAPGGSLNPTWVAWLMGWPLAHTRLRHWATAKSRCVPPQPGACSADP